VVATAPAHVAAGQRQTASDENNTRDWLNGVGTSYTPALQAATTNPTLGTGSSVFGRYIQVGKLVTAWIVIQFGSAGTNAGNGSYNITLPVTPKSTSQVTPIGQGRLKCAGTFKDAVTAVLSATTVFLKYTNAGADTNVSNTAPGAWTANDLIYVTVTYEAA
jgi:hypothetical protein